MRAPTAAADANQSESPESERQNRPPLLMVLAILIGSFLLFSSCAAATLGLGNWIVRVVAETGGTELSEFGPARAAWPADSAELTVAVSPSMAETLERRAEAFNSLELSTSDGRRMRVGLVAMSSQKIVERSLGQPAFQAIAPDSSLWLRQIDRLWASQSSRGPNSMPAKRIGATTRFALSPVVIAVRDAKARGLGWPARAIGWHDVFTLTLSEPEFELSRPRADSIAGLAATLAAYSIGAGASRGLSEEVAGGEQVLRYVREVEKTFLRNGAEAVTGPVDLDGLVAQEQAVVALNTSFQGGLAASESHFVAIYPREGTFWADHPMALLNLDGDGPALTRNQGRTYHAFAQFLLTEDSQIELMRAGFRPADLTIDMNVPPSPFENSVAVDLSEPKSLLRYPSAPFMQVLLDVWRVAGPPANFVLVVDASESMEGDKLSQSKATLHELIELMQDDHDRLGVIGIGSGLTNSRRVRWLDSEGRSRFRLELETMEAGGYTGLVDAVLEAHAALQQSGDAGAVNVIVVFSDGRDNDSESKLRNLHRAMGEGSIPVLIHTIGYGGDANERLLRELARIGDGQFHRAEGVDIEGLYRLIATHDLTGN